MLRAAGVEFEGEISFAGLHQLLLPILDRLPELPAGPREALTAALGLGSGSAGGQLMIVNAVLMLLSRHAEDGPVLLVVDDSAWLDRQSARTLSVVARRLTGGAVAFLAAARTEVDSFFDRTDLSILEIRPLADDAAARLLSLRDPALAPPAAQRCVRQSAGAAGIAAGG